MSARTTPNDAWSVAVRRVLAEPRRLEPHLQPVIDLASGRVEGHELLARFPEAPQVPVRAWFDAASRLGLSGPFEAQALRSALTLRGRGGAGTFVSVNLSPMALTSTEVAGVLGDGPLDGLVVEVLDRDDGAHPTLVRSALAGLAERGAALALDDAGRAPGGYARAGALRPRYVKLDGALVRGVVGDPDRSELVGTLREMGERLGAVLVAKGIETPEQLDAVVRLRVPLGQGRLLGAPVPVAQARALADPEQRTAPPAAASSSAGVAALGVPLVAVPRSPGLVGEALADRPELTHVLVVDADGYPDGLAERAAHARGEPPRAPLVVRGDVPVAEAAARAMDRPAASRFDPLVVVDARGAGVALVGVERLVAALAARR